jgi:hypothetical protein
VKRLLIAALALACLAGPAKGQDAGALAMVLAGAPVKVSQFTFTIYPGDNIFTNILSGNFIINQAGKFTQSGLIAVDAEYDFMDQLTWINPGESSVNAWWSDGTIEFVPGPGWLNGDYELIPETVIMPGALMAIMHYGTGATVTFFITE